MPAETEEITMNKHVPMTTDETRMASAIRVLSMDAVQAANSGHPGAPMGLADVATVLFNRYMNIDPSAPDWPDRDRFVMSAGHGSMLVYAINHLLGYDDMDAEQLRNFRHDGSLVGGWFLDQRQYESSLATYLPVDNYPHGFRVGCPRLRVTWNPGLEVLDEIDVR